MHKGPLITERRKRKGGAQGKGRLSSSGTQNPGNDLQSDHACTMCVCVCVCVCVCECVCLCKRASFLFCLGCGLSTTAELETAINRLDIGKRNESLRTDVGKTEVNCEQR